jgi:hypothetical protein
VIAGDGQKKSASWNSELRQGWLLVGTGGGLAADSALMPM